MGMQIKRQVRGTTAIVFWRQKSGTPSYHGLWLGTSCLFAKGCLDRFLDGILDIKKTHCA
jgi:hypothetical protein